MLKIRTTPIINAVVLGGGSGSPASIRAALGCGFRTTAIVAMADDGGSSGMLRSHTGKLPPGDIRKCLIAMAADINSPWVKCFRQRYQYLNNHNLGNLILNALEDATDSLPQAIALCQQLLNARGDVLPSTLDVVNLTAITRDGTQIYGQSQICASATAIASVALIGDNPKPFKPAITAIGEADLIIIGPGSLFTSLIAVLLVPGIIDAIKRSKAAVVYIAPTTDKQGETWGLTLAELVDTLIAHGLGSRLDAVVANSTDAQQTRHVGAVTSVFQAISDKEGIALLSTDSDIANNSRSLTINDTDIEHINQLGIALFRRQLTDSDRQWQHTPAALGAVFREVLEGCRSRRK